MKIIVLILMLILGYMYGERSTLTKVKKYIKDSKDWNEFMEKLSVDLNEYNIGE